MFHQVPGELLIDKMMFIIYDSHALITVFYTPWAL